MNTQTLARPWATAPARPAPSRAAAQDTGPNDADSAIRAHLLARLARQPGWEADRSSVDVYVEHGTVVLQGVARHRGARAAVRAIAAATPGVRQVRDARVLPRD